MSEKKYTVRTGSKTSHLLQNGFHIAENSSHPSDVQDLHRIADDLNRMADLERSHAELVEIVQLSKDRFSGDRFWMPHQLTDEQMRIKCEEAISRAQSLKIPTAAPQGQQ